MPSVGTTLTLDFLRKGRVHFLQLLALPIWPLLLYLVLDRTAQLETHELRFIFYMTLMMEGFCCTVMIGAIQADVNAANLLGGFPRRLYTLPVSTARLVFWQMLPGVAVIGLVHLYLAALIRLLTGVMPPLLEPILFVSLIYSSAMAVVWGLPGFAVLRIVALAAVAYFPGLWFTETYAPRVHLPPGMIWAPPQLASFLWMPLAILAAYAVAVWGVALDRRGEAWSLAGFKSMWDALLNRAPQRQRPFASPQAAQFWFELRQKGWIMPTGALVLSVVIPMIVLNGGIRNQQSVLLMALCGLPFYYVIPAALLTGIVLGITRPQPAGNELDLFRATRPVSDATLSLAMHKVGLFNILTGTAICLAAALGMSALMSLAGDGEHARQIWQNWVKEFGIEEAGLWAYPLYLALSVPGAWIILSLGTAIGQAGHGKLMASVTVGLMILVITTCFAQFWLPGQVTLWIVYGTLIALGAAFILGGGGAVMICWRRRMAGRVLTGASFGAWLLLLGLGVWVMLFIDLHAAWPVRFFWLGVMTLAPATPFIGALAMRWNRHR